MTIVPKDRSYFRVSGRRFRDFMKDRFKSTFAFRKPQGPNILDRLQSFYEFTANLKKAQLWPYFKTMYLQALSYMES